MIEVSYVEGIAVLRIEHGPVNALDDELLAGLAGALDEVEAEGAAAAVVMGKGLAFSAGADLIRLLDEGAAYVEAARPYASLVFRRMFLMPIPMVAAINGHAIAGGCVLALACDHRVSASGEHRIGLPELRVGVPFPMWALEIVRFALGPPHLQRMLYSGRLARPDEALTLGLIDEVVPPDTLLDAALVAARRLAAIPPPTFALTKSALREPFAQRARDAEPRDDEGMKIWASDEVRASVQRFIERTLGRTDRPSP
ncbi:MAG: enoyl-CoA hydratase/isomerase family protein [Actinomycetota bacterium]